MNNELWLDISEYENLYQVSNYGRIKSLNYRRTGKEQILKQATNKDGYKFVSLRKNGKGKTFTVHRLVAKAFIPSIENKVEINHIDCDKTNNCVSNLEWCTYSQNSLHALNNGIDIVKGLNNYNKNKFKNKYGKIYQYDKNNKLINIYNSLQEAYNETHTCTRNILQVINHEQGRKQANGFIWKCEKEVMKKC